MGRFSSPPLCTLCPASHHIPSLVHFSCSAHSLSLQLFQRQKENQNSCCVRTHAHGDNDGGRRQFTGARGASSACGRSCGRASQSRRGRPTGRGRRRRCARRTRRRCRTCCVAGLQAPCLRAHARGPRATALVRQRAVLQTAQVVEWVVQAQSLWWLLVEAWCLQAQRVVHLRQRELRVVFLHAAC